MKPWEKATLVFIVCAWTLKPPPAIIGVMKWLEDLEDLVWTQISQTIASW